MQPPFMRPALTLAQITRYRSKSTCAFNPPVLAQFHSSVDINMAVQLAIALVSSPRCCSYAGDYRGPYRTQPTIV